MNVDKVGVKEFLLPPNICIFEGQNFFPQEVLSMQDGHYYCLSHKEGFHKFILIFKEVYTLLSTFQLAIIRMTAKQFINLDEMEQAETLWDKGVHIGERFDKVYSILLYQIDNFYVEAFFNRDHNSLVRFEAFSDVKELTPYLDQISVAALINGKTK